MVFELSDREVQDMQHAVGANAKLVKKVITAKQDAETLAKCTCPIKIESTDLKKQKKKLKQQKRGITFQRKHTNGYDLGRKLCPVHDITMSKL